MTFWKTDDPLESLNDLDEYVDDPVEHQDGPVKWQDDLQKAEWYGLIKLNSPHLTKMTR